MQICFLGCDLGVCSDGLLVVTDGSAFDGGSDRAPDPEGDGTFITQPNKKTGGVRCVSSVSPGLQSEDLAFAPFVDIFGET